MEQEYTWWATLGNSIKGMVKLSWWNPLDKFEIRRSVKIERFHNKVVPFISVTFAVWFIKFDWKLYIG